MIFTEKPLDFNSATEIVACYVAVGDKVLWLCRHAAKPNGTLWGLPAGKVDRGEDPRTAMVRELHEETGISLVASELEPIDTIYVRHDGREFAYHSFRAEFREQPPVHVNPIEHQAYQWCTPQDSLQLPLVPDQAECTRRVFGLYEDGAPAGRPS